MAKRSPFYGWLLIGVAWVIYGFGISPGYYSWGLFLPELLADLNLTRAQAGGVFGLFTFCYSATAPLSGLAISRWGIRTVMIVGSLLAGLGFVLLSRADSLLDCYIAYSLLAGVGIGLSTILPCQTLATNWFDKYRATAVAVIFTAGGIVGKIIARIDARILEESSWRNGWVLIAGISAAVALIAAVMVRNTPEDLGQRPDGRRPEDEPPSGPQSSEPRPPAASATAIPTWTAAEAMRTRQFLILNFCGIAFAVPWGVMVTHGRLHLQDLGISTETAAAIIGTMALVSILGRLTGFLGDLVPAQRVLAVSLLVEGAGVAGLLVADTPRLAYACLVFLGLGFGAAYISIAVVFATFFGRHAFATTQGTRMLVTGIFNAIAPALAGRAFDLTGSYNGAFTIIAAITFAGAVAAFLSKPPVPTEEPPAVAAEGLA